MSYRADAYGSHGDRYRSWHSPKITSVRMDRRNIRALSDLNDAGVLRDGAAEESRVGAATFEAWRRIERLEDLGTPAAVQELMYRAQDGDFSASMAVERLLQDDNEAVLAQFREMALRGDPKAESSLVNQLLTCGTRRALDELRIFAGASSSPRATASLLFWLAAINTGDLDEEILTRDAGRPYWKGFEVRVLISSLDAPGALEEVVGRGASASGEALALAVDRLAQRGASRDLYMLRRLAMNGVVAAQRELEARAIAKYLPASQEALRDACAAGDSDACWDLAEFLASLNTPESIEELRERADGDDVWARMRYTNLLAELADTRSVDLLEQRAGAAMAGHRTDWPICAPAVGYDQGLAR